MNMLRCWLDGRSDWELVGWLAFGWFVLVAAPFVGAAAVDAFVGDEGIWENTLPPTVECMK